MTEIELSASQEATGRRARIYALLSQGFDFPSRSFYEDVRRGTFLAQAQAEVRGVPYSVVFSGALGTDTPLSFDEFQSEYIATFALGGAKGSPCPIHEGEYGGGRTKVMEEALRFYHHFGLRLSRRKEKRDRPDHLATELEFMHSLIFREAEAVIAGRSPEAYRSAQQDFLRYHLADFLAALAGELAPRDIPFYSDLINFGDRFCRADLSYVRTLP